MNRLVMAVIALPVTFSAGVLAGVLASPAAPSNDPISRIQPCRGEDGAGPAPCLWDAKVRGNGAGRSFISPHGRADGERVYLG